LIRKGRRRVIVLTNYADRPDNMLIVKDGSGGYAWQYLPDIKIANRPAVHDILENRLGLHRKSERTRFIDK